ncbi:uncharacterized protein LOC131935080 [Physella acuta]|uniref:uncharacterized protein LOC131935080 n=1 Tax=Physella acuta TaxID=109671 RepID=UPI0027DCC81C|nr:uncharacterized protein LOC131935080 [Physella acuta]
MNVRNCKNHRCMIPLVCIVCVSVISWTVYLKYSFKENLFAPVDQITNLRKRMVAPLTSTHDGGSLHGLPGTVPLHRAPDLKIDLATLKPELVIQTQEVITQKPEMTREKPELTREKPELTRDKPELTRENPELTREKPELTREKPEVTRDKPELTTHKLEVTTLDHPEATFKYNFTLEHETWPTVFFNVTIPQSNFTRSPKNVQRKKLILPQPQVMPPSVPWPETNDTVRYLVYLCDGRNMCGGMGDRQRGLVAVYVLSRMVNRRFGMIMISPCNITNFFMPFKTQWIPPPDLERPSKNNTIITMTTEGRLLFTNLTAGDFNEMFPQKVLYIKTNTDLFAFISRNKFYSSLLKQWNGLLNNRGRFHWAWGQLMQPSSAMLADLVSILGGNFLKKKGLLPVSEIQPPEVKSLYNVGNSSLICAHVRIGQNPSNPFDGPFTAVTVKDLPLLYNFMLSKDTNGNAMFYVATDYINVRIQSRNFFGKRFIEYGAKITHIDRTRTGSEACDGFKWNILDQFILSLCDVLVISPSGFSIRAYYISNSADSTYILENGKITPFYE